MGNHAFDAWLDSPESLTDDQVELLEAVAADRERRRDAEADAMLADEAYMQELERRAAHANGEAT